MASWGVQQQSIVIFVQSRKSGHQGMLHLNEYQTIKPFCRHHFLTKNKQTNKQTKSVRRKLNKFSSLPVGKGMCHSYFGVSCGDGDKWGCRIRLSLHWRHNKRDGVSNHQPHDRELFNHLFRHRSRKTSKLCVTGLSEGNSLILRTNGQ